MSPSVCELEKLSAVTAPAERLEKAALAAAGWVDRLADSNISANNTCVIASTGAGGLSGLDQSEPDPGAPSLPQQLYKLLGSTLA